MTGYLFQNKEVFILIFIIIHKKVVEVANTMTVTTANEREVTARCHRTQIIVKRKHTLYAFSRCSESFEI